MSLCLCEFLISGARLISSQKRPRLTFITLTVSFVAKVVFWHRKHLSCFARFACILRMLTNLQMSWVFNLSKLMQIWLNTFVSVQMGKRISLRMEANFIKRGRFKHRFFIIYQQSFLLTNVRGYVNFNKNNYPDSMLGHNFSLNGNFSASWNELSPDYISTI